VLCIERKGRWLIEQRPLTGRWAAMWQFVTIEAGSAKQHALRRGNRIGTVSHALSHRRYEFRIFAGERLKGNSSQNGKCRAWVTLKELDHYPLPRPHLKIASMLAARHVTPSGRGAVALDRARPHR
jgi:adenine-specific DNA glycosylase